MRAEQVGSESLLSLALLAFGLLAFGSWLVLASHLSLDLFPVHVIEDEVEVIEVEVIEVEVVPVDFLVFVIARALALVIRALSSLLGLFLVFLLAFGFVSLFLSILAFADLSELLVLGVG